MLRHLKQHVIYIPLNKACCIFTPYFIEGCVGKYRPNSMTVNHIFSNIIKYHITVSMGSNSKGRIANPMTCIYLTPVNNANGFCQAPKPLPQQPILRVAIANYLLGKIERNVVHGFDKKYRS